MLKKKEDENTKLSHRYKSDIAKLDIVQLTDARTEQKFDIKELKID